MWGRLSKKPRSGVEGEAPSGFAGGGALQSPYNRSLRIADKLFYPSISLLVLALGGMGSFLIRQRLEDVSREIMEKLNATVAYLEQNLPATVIDLNVKKMRQALDASFSQELQTVEIFDTDGERIYVYERVRPKESAYDYKMERVLRFKEQPAGKMIAYFSVGPLVRQLKIRESLRLIILISAAGLILGIGLTLLVRQVILKPIEKTLAFSKALALENYDQRIVVSTKDEMGTLQHSLNQMAEALSLAFRQLKNAVAETQKAHQQALEASRVKSEFLANMSHEIRTPMNAIVGFTNLLLENEGDPERIKQMEAIRQSADVLLENINEILDFSKIERGNVVLTQTSFDLRKFLEEIRRIIELKIKDRKILFAMDIAPEVSEIIQSDCLRLRQILLNLLINATKFTPEGKIDLKVSTEAGPFLRFEVKDTGIGIPFEHQQRIFEPFTQVDSSFTRKFGGTGLGLAIAKRLVEALGGNIGVDSQPGNTNFYFTIPLG